MGSEVPPSLAYRAVDFARAASVLSNASVVPGPKRQGYIARKVFAELVRLEATNPSVNISTILDTVTRVHDTKANTEELIATYNSEKTRVERSLKAGRKAVQARLDMAGGVLGAIDYEYLRSTHGLDEDMVMHIQKNST